MDRYKQLPELPAFFDESAFDIDRPLVVAHMMKGGDHIGEFLGFDLIEHVVVMEGADKVITCIPLHDLRFLEFSERLNLSPSMHKETPVPEGYLIQFSDNKTLSGKTYSHLLDEHGLHIFSSLNSNRVEWLFIPIDIIADYSFGSGLAQGSLIESDFDETVSAPGLGVCCSSREELAASLNLYASYLETESNELGNKRIGEILIEENIITAPVLNEAIKQQSLRPGRKLGAILESMGQITTEQINQKLAGKLGIPLVTLKHFDVDMEALNSIPQQFCSRYHLLPLFYFKDHLVVALDDPLNFEALDMVRFISGKAVDSVLASTRELEDATNRLYGHEKDIDDGFSKAEADIQLIDGKLLSDESAEMQAKDKPVVRLVMGILSDAVQKRASDIHIRPLDNSVQLLYRIDGSLVEIRTFSRSLLPLIITRIKVLGRMDVAERRRPQDGRARFSDGGNLVDMRISVIPTVIGESAVIRLLNTRVGLRSLDELGLVEADQEQLVELLHKSHGMFLVTGPTGSGKSTTLYAALQSIKSENVNMITVEDPVEYQISGIEQIQVQSNYGYTFAESLRHILRHDPDVIMIGEIRDVETAKIAVESALTGHLVLSTLHTNSAAGTVTRLLEMGVEPYLVSSTLLGVLAQRLVKLNCRHCLDVEPVNHIVRRSLGISEDEKFYKGTGCDECNGTGSMGRMAVYELLSINRELRILIERTTSTDEILQCAANNGMTNLTENALVRARDKLISLEEVYRVRLD